MFLTNYGDVKLQSMYNSHRDGFCNFIDIDVCSHFVLSCRFTDLDNCLYLLDNLLVVLDLLFDNT